jgi:hypothetical protein
VVTPLRATDGTFAASGPLAAPAVLERLAAVRPVTLAALLRIARRVSEGFEGDVQLTITHGGVRSVRWVETETGDEIKEELE